MRPLDVLVASKDGKLPGGLRHLGLYYLYTSQEKPWERAANDLLSRATSDTLFIDDDVTLTPYTFDLLDKYWDRADIFGFTLVYPNNPYKVQSAGFTFQSIADLPGGKQDARLYPQPPVGMLTPSLVPHVTSSCMVIKKRVLDAGLRFPEWPGLYYEDVAFTFDAWLHGFKVAYLPGVAIHHMGSPTEGATKAKEADLERRKAINRGCLARWQIEHGVQQALDDGRIPLEARPIV